MSNENSHLFAGKRAVVTGAGRGIGRSIALALAQAGADVAVTARTHLEIEQRYGRIINIASIASRVGGSYIAAYTAAKHGVLGLTRALAVELMPYNITVNAICPGYVNTPMTDASVSNIAAHNGIRESKAREALENTSPQKRLIEPEEVASLAVFLAQDISKGITGQGINLDGGGQMS